MPNGVAEFDMHSYPQAMPNPARGRYKNRKNTLAKQMAFPLHLFVLLKPFTANGRSDRAIMRCYPNRLGAVA
jgi:hypothetical protein